MQIATIIIGEDDYLVETAAKKAVGSAQGVEVVDSRMSTREDLQLADIAAVRESFLTPSLLEPEKTTWWKNVGFLPQGPGRSAPSKNVKAALEKFAESIASASSAGEGQRLVVSGSKLLATSKFAKTLSAVAKIKIFPSLKPWEAAQAALSTAAGFAADAGLDFAPGALEAFIAKTGADSRSISNEIAKLKEYVGDEKRPATKDDVSAVTSPGIGMETFIWDLTDALGERNAAKAFAAASGLSRQNGFAVFVTAGVEKFFRQLAAMADAASRGDADASALGMAPFVFRKNMAFISKWSVNELRLERARFLALREKAVSGGGDSVDALVFAEIMRACAAGGRNRG